MLVHVATQVSFSSLSSLSSVVCIHIDQNVAEQKQYSNVYDIKAMWQCSNVAYQSNALEQKQCSISKQCGNVAYQSNVAI
jgi:hypothetical protein